MTIVALVLTQLLVIAVALRSRTLGLRQYLVILLITLIQVGIIVFYLCVVEPPTLN